MYRIADREPAALAELYRLQVRPIFGHVRARIDDIDAAATITRAAFVEMWRLAPARRQLYDARSWLLRIADRRIGEHLRSQAWPATLGAGYDEHMRLESDALIRLGPSDDSDRRGDSAVGCSRVVLPRDGRVG
ncbi:RNA polymerase sigma factor [Dactylosporangium cerinum]|uniref:RNA polymerase sigma factor n=1 Tax=Dactylosporangium cerinum TaxID=1434730 RepID=A0ABV9VL84_9ACTN